MNSSATPPIVRAEVGFRWEDAVQLSLTELKTLAIREVAGTPGYAESWHVDGLRMEPGWVFLALVRGPDSDVRMSS